MTHCIISIPKTMWTLLQSFLSPSPNATIMLASNTFVLPVFELYRNGNIPYILFSGFHFLNIIFEWFIYIGGHGRCMVDCLIITLLHSLRLTTLVKKVEFHPLEACFGSQSPLPLRARSPERLVMILRQISIYDWQELMYRQASSLFGWVNPEVHFILILRVSQGN